MRSTYAQFEFVGEGFSRSDVKRGLIETERLSIYQSIYIPTLSYGRELWVVNERTSSWIPAVEMSLLCRESGLRRLGVKSLLLYERSWMRRFKQLMRMPPRHLPEVFSGMTIWEEGVDPKELVEVAGNRGHWFSLMVFLLLWPGLQELVVNTWMDTPRKSAPASFSGYN